MKTEEERLPVNGCWCCVWRGTIRKDGWLRCKMDGRRTYQASICPEYERDII